MQRKLTNCQRRAKERRAKERPQRLRERWLSMVHLADYLGVTTMSIRRWSSQEKYAHLNFPQPPVICDRRYWDIDEVDAWMRTRVGAVSSRMKESVA